MAALCHRSFVLNSLRRLATIAIPEASQVRIPSRQMPQARVLGLFGKVLSLVLLVLLLGLPGLAWSPLTFPLPVFVLVGTLIGWWRDRRVARARAGQSICDFARAFDCRNIDTWIIRAVYEEFSGQFPVRASDDLKHDLRIAGDDLDYIGVRLAQRTGRSLERSEDNPMFGNVRTLRDLVMFLDHQQQVSTPSVHQQA